MNFPKQPGESPFLEQAEEDVLSQPENDPVPDEADFRWPYERDPRDFVAAGLCPVWSHEHGYTGDEETMSEDLKDLMTPEMKSISRLMGPLKSLLWLAGLDDMVDAVDDPAFTITDEVLQVSMNTDIPFILRALHYAGKVPDCVMQLLYGRPTGKLNSYMQFLLAYRPHEPIPSAVTTSPTNLDLTEVFPYGQNQNCNFPLQIRCLRVKWEKNCARLRRQIEDKLNGSVNNGRQLYRGLWSRQILDSQMMYLSPVALSANTENEFGNGIYTTPSMEFALGHASPVGALLVFKDPNFRHLKHWVPNTEDWNTIISYWTRKRLSNAEQRVPPGWVGVEIIEGPISTGRHRTPGPHTQVVSTNWRGAHALEAALDTIIWFE